MLQIKQQKAKGPSKYVMCGSGAAGDARKDPVAFEKLKKETREPKHTRLFQGFV